MDNQNTEVPQNEQAPQMPRGWSKSKPALIWGGIVVLALVIVGIYIGGKNSTPTELTFGMITGLSGDYAAVGESTREGAILAQEEWNMNHPDKQIKMIIEDDGFDSKKGISAYRKLKDIDRVDALINMTTITIDAIYDEISKTGIPVALGFEQGIDAEDDNVFQLWPGTVPAEEELGKYIKDKGFKNIAVFVDNKSPAFFRFFKGFENGYELPLTEIQVGEGASDIKSSALKAVEINPDAIVFIIRPTQGALLVKELNVLSRGSYQYVFDANIQTGFPDYVNILGSGDVLNGSILYTVPNTYRKEFTDNFTNRFGHEPGVGSETGYNAFMLLALSYDSDWDKWVKNMRDIKFAGADGEIVFNDVGMRIPVLKIGTIQNGELPE